MIDKVNAYYLFDKIKELHIFNCKYIYAKSLQERINQPVVNNAFLNKLIFKRATIKNTNKNNQIYQINNLTHFKKICTLHLIILPF